MRVHGDCLAGAVCRLGPALCVLLAVACIPGPGTERCTEPVVVNSSQLVCNAPRMRVGAYPVTVSLNGANSTSSDTLHRLCDQDWFGLPGEECGPCPEVRRRAAGAWCARGRPGHP